MEFIHGYINIPKWYAFCSLSTLVITVALVPIQLQRLWNRISSEHIP